MSNLKQLPMPTPGRKTPSRGTREPVHIARLVELLGSHEAVGRAIDCTGNTIGQGLARGEITSAYEMAAELVLLQMEPKAETSRAVALVTAPADKAKLLEEFVALAGGTYAPIDVGELV